MNERVYFMGFSYPMDNIRNLLIDVARIPKQRLQTVENINNEIINLAKKDLSTFVTLSITINKERKKYNDQKRGKNYQSNGLERG